MKKPHQKWWNPEIKVGKQKKKMKFGMLLRLGVMNLILISSHSTNIQGRKPCSCDFIKLTTFISHLDIYTPISFKPSMIDTTELYTSRVLMILTFIQGHSLRNAKFCAYFLTNSLIDFDEI